MQVKKRVVGLGIGLCMAAAITGCKDNSVEQQPKSIVYEFGKNDITYGEFYIYAKTVAEDYQQTYGDGIWSLELTDEKKNISTVKEVTLKDLVNNINRVKVMCDKAKEMEITLTEEEKADAENRAEQFYNGLTEEDIAQTELTKELVVQVIEENLIAQKVYNQVIADYDFEISDEEARIVDFYDILFETHTIKKDGTVKKYSEEKKAEQLEKANKALSSLAQDEGVTYDSIVKKFKLQYASSYTMSKTEVIETYGESVAEKILALKDGGISTVIESEYGYHIFKMIKAQNESKTKENKQKIVRQKQKEYFKSEYEKWLKKYDAGFNFDQDLNKDLLEKFPFSTEGTTE